MRANFEIQRSEFGDIEWKKRGESDPMATAEDDMVGKKEMIASRAGSAWLAFAFAFRFGAGACARARARPRPPSPTDSIRRRGDNGYGKS